MTLKKKLRAGGKIYGTMIRVLRNPAVCYLAKNSGLDFVMYDCEHSDYSMETLHDLFLMGNALGLPGMIRAQNLEKQYVSRTLDQGAAGVMVPMINTAKLAARLVECAKYAPQGDRGFATNIAHTGYAIPGKHSEVMRAANDAVLAIAQIETKAAVDNADAIAGSEGIDALLIGPNDLSLSLGIPGDLFNPAELDAIKHVAAACKRHGKAFGLHAGEKMLQMFRDELSIVMMQSDSEILAHGFSRIRAAFE